MSYSSDFRRQRGDVLLESLIGVLITALIAAGMSHVASRIMASQYETAADALVVNQLRNTMQMHGVDLCNDASPLEDGQLTGLPASLRSEVSISLHADSCDGGGTGHEAHIGTVAFPGAMPDRVKIEADRGDGVAVLVSSEEPAQ